MALDVARPRWRRELAVRDVAASTSDGRGGSFLAAGANDGARGLEVDVCSEYDVVTEETVKDGRKRTQIAAR
jgi:hypothetical protein